MDIKDLGDILFIAIKYFRYIGKYFELLLKKEFNSLCLAQKVSVYV